MRFLQREYPDDHLPFLRWLMFTGVCAFGFVLAWHYGLFHLMLASDKTYISALIVVLYFAAAAHCCVRTAAISRETDRAQRVASLVRRDALSLRVDGADVVTANGMRLPRGQVTGHIRNLILKAGCRVTAGSIRRCCCADSPTRCAAPTSSVRSPATRS